MEGNVTQINCGITRNVNVRVKNVMHVKKVLFGIVLHVAVRLVKYLASTMNDSAIRCDEFIESYGEDEADADVDAKWNNETNSNDHAKLYG